MASQNMRQRQTTSGRKAAKLKVQVENVPVEAEPWTPGTYTAFKALLSARLCAAIWSNISDCDETYNYWEPTHFLIYGNGFQTWEYSPKYAIRSYFYLVLHAVPGWLYAKLAQADKILVFYFIRCLLGFSSAACEAYFYKGVCHKFNGHVGRLTLVFLLFGSGMFISSAAFLPSSFTMYFTLLALGAWFVQNFKVAILSIAASTFIGWPFTALIGVPIAYDILFIQKKYIFFIKWCIFAVVFILIPVVQVDSYFYGKLVIAPLNIVLYNVFTSHGPDLYGTESWQFYFFNGFLNFNFVFLLSIAVLPILVLRYLFFHSSKSEKSSHWLYTTPLYCWIAIFFLQPHKEERFLFPIYPLFGLCGAIALDVIQELIYYLIKKKRKQYVQATWWIAFSFAFITSLLSLSRSLALYKAYHAPFDTYMAAAQMSYDQSSVSPTNICVGKEWHRFPSNFFLPFKWNLQFIKSEFQGQLPQPYVSQKNATKLIPRHVNDENKEEPTRYISINDCDYLIDLDLPDHTENEPRYSQQTEHWTIIKSISYLDSKRSHPILRAFYIPFLSEYYCTVVNYNLLQSTQSQKKKTKKFKV